jgi:hypothetical protein
MTSLASPPAATSSGRASSGKTRTSSSCTPAARRRCMRILIAFGKDYEWHGAEGIEHRKKTFKTLCPILSALCPIEVLPPPASRHPPAGLRRGRPARPG